MTYTWEILKFATRDQTNSSGAVLQDSVVSIQWRRSGMDADGNVASVVGYTVMTAEEVEENAFIPFNDLTESDVVGWLESVLSPQKLQDYDNTIQDKINRRVTTEKAVPWKQLTLTLNCVIIKNMNLLWRHLCMTCDIMVLCTMR